MDAQIKGPLYGEIGRVCTELTSWYITLDTFKFVTCFQDMQFHLNKVQDEKLRDIEIAKK